MIEADVKRLEIEALRYSAERDRWQQTFAMFAVAILMGAVIGLVITTHAR